MAVVCDGLGGLSLGEVASGNVILAFDKWFKEQFMAGAEWTGESIRNSWEDIIYSMNQKIKEYGASQGRRNGNDYYGSSILKRINTMPYMLGDSRLYELSDGCRQIHRGSDINCKRTGTGNYHERTGVDRQPAQCALQCIGVTQKLLPAFYIGNINGEAAYLVCSDGFRHVITPDEIYQLCRPLQNLTQKVMQVNLTSLVERVKQRGERDNISAVLIQVGRETC